jgi:hypothetical protein
MMLVERDDVEAEFLGVEILVDVVVVILRRSLAIEIAVGDREVGAVFEDDFFRNPADRTFGEIS